MGKSYSGDFTFNAAFDVNAGKPIDTRLVVDALTDLTDSISYPYVGLLVYVKGEGKYYAYKETSSNVFEWVELTTSGGTSVSSLDDVPDGSTRKLADYLPLKGGAITGRITRNSGGTYIKGRDNALVFNNKSNGQSSWNPIWSQKTANGAWTAGSIGNEDILRLVYDTDVNYNGNNNNTTYNISFPTKTGTLAIISDIPSVPLTLTKNQIGFSISGGTTSKTLTVNADYTLGAACAKGVTDNSISADVFLSDTNLITARTLYYQLLKKGYTTNVGTVTGVNVGPISYTPTNGVVSLPAYPTLSSLGAAASSHTHNQYLTSVPAASSLTRGGAKIYASGDILYISTQ